MFDYFKCITLFVITVSVLSLFGKCIEEQEHDFSYRFLLGYFVFTFYAAVPGLIAQFFSLPWKIYETYYVILCFIITIYVIIKIRKKHCYSIKNLKLFFKENYFLFVMSFLLVLISFLYVWLFWANNHSDDGYYIGKIAEFPYLNGFYKVDVANGFKKRPLDSYFLNTYELQASITPYLFKINPVIYVRFFMNLFNYFIMVCMIKGLSYEIIQRIKEGILLEKTRNLIQYITLVALVFSFNSYFLLEFNIITSNDLWQFNSGMYLASSIIRTSGLGILLMFYINKTELNFKNVLFALILSVSFISKSTIALPLLVIFALVYFSIHLFRSEKNGLIIGILFSLCIVVVCLILNNNTNIESLILNYLMSNLKSFLMIICLGIIILSFFSKEKKVCYLNLFLLLFAMFLFLNPINNIFELSSVYPFVGGRINTNYLYTVVIISTIYLFIFFSTIIRKEQIITALCILSFFVLSFCSYKSFSLLTGSLVDSYKILYQNKELIPKSTMLLSKELDKLSKEIDVIVIAPSLPLVNGKLHTLTANLRFWAPNIKNISILNRFKNEYATDYSDFNQDYQDAYDKFSVNPNDSTATGLYDIYDNFYITCYVVEDENATPYFEKIGFSLKSKVTDEVNGKNYYIYTNCYN